METLLHFFEISSRETITKSTPPPFYYLANEVRRRIGCLWLLRGSVACFHELYLQTKFSDIREWSQWGGFDLVDLKCAENNCVATPMLAYFETKFFDLLSNKIYKINTTEPVHKVSEK